MPHELTWSRGKTAYILRIEREGARLTLYLQDLRSREQWRFCSWEELRQHVERWPPQKLR